MLFLSVLCRLARRRRAACQICSFTADSCSNCRWSSPAGQAVCAWPGRSSTPGPWAQDSAGTRGWARIGSSPARRRGASLCPVLSRRRRACAARLPGRQGHGLRAEAHSGRIVAQRCRLWGGRRRKLGRPGSGSAMAGAATWSEHGGDAFSLSSAYNDAPMPCQGIRVTFSGLISGVLKDGERSILLGCGQDREGPLG